MSRKNILVIGRANSGKTHFAGQLYGRLKEPQSSLKINETPGNLEMLGEVFEALSEGKASDHTVAGTWDSLKLSLIDKNGKEFEINWPEYAGEQWDAIFSTRSLDEKWKNQLDDSDKWLVIIRVENEPTFPDFLEKLANNEKPEKKHESPNSTNWDANAYWVEKLQILLQLSKTQIANKVQSPKVAVLLSCYDEVNTENGTPYMILEQRLPMLASYLVANWNKDKLSIWGLSSLGKELTEASKDDDFIDEGPETQGWVISPDETIEQKNTDLTLPIKWLLND
ncbi:TRAFAC clade GTPase domain-containing protein [Psychrobacter nivimaris]|uniref:TRAFAC clade GTPase domain-containing protein n=1 Tax=Psychrobacter nivimaris TaxID=281738 RepID=UPI003735CED3